MPVNLNFMNKYLLLFIFCVASFTQLHAQQWLTNFQQAKELSTTQEKTILLVFQGSDWCAPCIKLNREIFETEHFLTYAKDHFIMLQADFPRRKKNALVQNYKPTTMPWQSVTIKEVSFLLLLF